ncbi:hypothetical protein AKJ66_03050 [candidate division MSBL1 archaeon SCGC-AAA259E22]|uniref:Transposase IS4-like domain-containing protein n=1 Tax=candidate division MSBL1 archaeon SCGC-AAA259E22 TaxID=1698265 RepID=A0A133UFI5_9EURY|nr:hypothetical protein AKJ66_03050 [candidate division MSBL1 archaeon SCGC-AAA259E22]
MPDLPDWVLKHKKKGVEIQERGEGNYYAYKITSKWDPEKGRPQKITEEYLGKVVKGKGIVPPKHKRKRKVEAVLETGNVQLLEHVFEPLEEGLKEEFPDSFQTILSMAALKLCYSSPLKNMKMHHETSWSHRVWSQASLSRNTLTERLREWGRNHGGRLRTYRSLLDDGDNIAIDLSQVFSESENIDWLEAGHNVLKEHRKQLQLLLIYNLSQHVPAFLKLLPGSIRDVSSLENAVREAGLEDVLLVFDKSFWSGDNLGELEGRDLGYLAAVRRNAKMLETEPETAYEDYFSWRGRYIWYRSYSVERGMVHHFLDKKLRAEEENSLLQRIEDGKEDPETLEKKRNRLGTLALLTNRDFDSEEAYKLYKQRDEIEKAFDGLTNTLEADKSYMQDREAIQGYMFVQFAALYVYSRILGILREKDLISKYSVRDVLTYLSKVYRVTVDGNLTSSEVPKKTRDMIEKLDLPITQNL